MSTKAVGETNRLARMRALWEAMYPAPEERSVWDALAEPFPHWDLDWRIQSFNPSDNWAKDGIRAACVPYVTARAVQARLDDVVGPANWRNEFKEAPGGRGIVCGISIRVAPDEWVTKWDGAAHTKIEPEKGGLSASFKRAAVQWGIARYLYFLERTRAENCSVKKKDQRYRNTSSKGRFWWDPPKLPKWALPGGSGMPPDPGAVEKLDEPLAADGEGQSDLTEELWADVNGGA